MILIIDVEERGDVDYLELHSFYDTIVAENLVEEFIELVNREGEIKALEAIRSLKK